MIAAFKRYGFFVAVLLLHAVYFLAAVHYGNICNGDTSEYVYEAVNILDRFFFYCGNPVLPVEVEYMTLRTPGYPLFLAGVYFFWVNNFMVLLLQNALSVFNIFYCRKTFMQLGYTSRYDAAFFLLLLFFPSQLVYANLIAPDLLLQTCTLIYFRYALLFLQKKTSRAVWLMSLALIVGLFIKPVLYPFALIHLCMIIGVAVFYRVNMRKVFIASLLPFMSILLYSGINQARTGKFHFSSIQSFNAIFYYHHYIGEKTGFEDADKWINQKRAEISALPGFKERYEKANAEGIHMLRKNFSSYMIYHISKSGRFFLETGRGELDEFTGRLTLRQLYSGTSKKFTTLLKELNTVQLFAYLKENSSAVFALFIACFNLIKIGGLFLFLRYAKAEAVVKWFIALFLLYFALITGPISNAHYTMPVSIIIMCCALTGYFYTFNKANRRTPYE